MELKSGLFSIIIVSIMVIAIGIIVNGWSEDYNSGVTSDLENYDNLNKSYGVSIEQRGNINPASGEAGTDSESLTFRGAYGIITGIYESFDLVFGENGMVDSVSERFGLPDYLKQGIIALMIISITFTIIAIVFRLSRSSA